MTVIETPAAAKKRANLYSAEARTAAKDRMCDYCHHWIRKGERYQRTTTAVDGKWSSISLHVQCRLFGPLHPRLELKTKRGFDWSPVMIGAGMIGALIAAFALSHMGGGR